MLQPRRLLWFIVLACVTACRQGDGLARVDVRGTVIYEGTPAKHGMITFRPVHGSKGPAAGTAIIDGKFHLPADKGPVIGAHEVEIKIVGAAPEVTKSDESKIMRRGGQLKTFSQQVNVASGMNEFKFSFPSTPPSPEKSGPK